MLHPINTHADLPNNPTWIVLNQGKVLVREQENDLPQLPWQELGELHAYGDEIKVLADLDGERSEYCVIDTGAASVTIDGFEFVSLRQIMMNSAHDSFGVLGRVWQLVYFYQTHRFCGRCGSTMHAVDWESALQCHNCGMRSYPRVSPCVIVAIYRDDEILLAQGKRHANTGMFSTIAGFVESGESLEQAVKREVKEEVGVNVAEPEYFGSQPWPFPHALMVGYLAEWESGDIKIDDHEIAQAHWYKLDDLPKIPPVFSIAGQLIEAVQRRQAKN